MTDEADSVISHHFFYFFAFGAAFFFAGVFFFPAAERTTAWFAVSFSAVNPFEKPSRYLWKGIELEGQAVTVHSFSQTYYCFFSGTVTRGQEAHVVCQRYGETYRFTVPLPWEEAVE